MAIWYRDTGTWRRAIQFWYRDNTVWRKMHTVWYKDAGVWVKVHGEGPVAAINGFGVNGYQNFPGTAQANLYFYSSGLIEGVGSNFNDTPFRNNSQWYDPVGGTPGNGYWVRATLTGGSPPNVGGLSMGTWYQLSSARLYGLSTQNFMDCSLRIDIASDAAGTNIVGTGNFTLYAESVAF